MRQPPPPQQQQQPITPTPTQMRERHDDPQGRRSDRGVDSEPTGAPAEAEGQTQQQQQQQQREGAVTAPQKQLRPSADAEAQGEEACTTAPGSHGAAASAGGAGHGLGLINPTRHDDDDDDPHHHPNDPTRLHRPSTITTTTSPEDDEDAAASSYEQRHVHGVYEQIAPHFSSTRYKPWPLVSSFLQSRPPGSVGLDVGCGNGKYLAVNPDVHVVGSDRSAALVRLARDYHGGGGGGGGGVGGGIAGEKNERRNDVAVADGLALPFRRGGADFVICVAVVHHLSTRERRVEGVRALLDCVRDDGDVEDGGRVLVYVWALEQGGSRRGWDEGTDPDQLVPWVMKSKKKQQKKPQRKMKKKNKKEEGVEEDGEGGEEAGAVGGDDADVDNGGEKTYQRYYHLYRKGELEEDMVAAGGEVLDSGYERDNWWVIGSRAGSSSTSAGSKVSSGDHAEINN